MVDPDRLSAAYETARCDLLAESATAGHWIGEISSSAFSTAAAVSALAIVERHAPTVAGRFADENRECRLSELIMVSLRRLAKQQNPDGGWGDTDQSPSNIGTTMLVRAAFALTCVPADHPGLLERADAYLKAQGGLRALRRYFGRDKVWLVPILTNCALAGLVPWRKVPAAPSASTLLRQAARKLFGLPETDETAAVLHAIGQSRVFHRRSWNPMARVMLARSFETSLSALEAVQSESGGIRESAPLVSFLVMSLAASGRSDHRIVRKGVEFLLATVRNDGSWPITTNLATWNTTLAVNALAAAGEDVREVGCLDWLLTCQRRHPDASLGDAPGGWGWTDAPGAVADVDDTAGALLALAAWSRAEPSALDKMRGAVAAGVKWLVEMQNPDGGWSVFGHGREARALEKSGCDLTAHALRALHAWRSGLIKVSQHAHELRTDLEQQIDGAIERGFRFLRVQQHPRGYWLSARFGDARRADRDNPVYGTARVLAAFRELGRLDTDAAHRALQWLLSNDEETHGDSNAGESATQPFRRFLGVEEAALRVEALLTCGRTQVCETVALQQLKWLIDTVEANRHHVCAPIGLVAGKLWYGEKLYPLITTVAALGQAARRFLPKPAPPAVVHSGKI